MDGLLYSNSARFIKNDPFYQEADVAHFHIFYDGMFSLYSAANMMRDKPSAWTLHDFWPLTGHCIHPTYPTCCDGWRSGCQTCPDLLRNFSMRADKAGQMWKIKKQLYQQIDPDIVVATSWMEHYVRESPLMEHFSHIHRIPFGVHLEQYGQTAKEEARSQFAISPESFVVAFRAEYAPDYTLKGSQYIWEALRGIDENVVVFTVGREKAPQDILDRFQVIQLGWVNDAELMSAFFSACDVFLMPSAAETFGLMAVEAMASARPVVVFEGTVLQSVTYAPECGIAVPYKSSEGLREAVIRLIGSPEERLYRGQLGRGLAEQHYRFEDYVDRHISLYQEIMERKAAG